ncbi:MAG: 2,3-bisphosphoglycerate-independent phosphoglycerate mutase, partial [Candidatus Bipolaricaulota bacterium]|nr:2,3-bisphosphoglycerate-independent phosphoglycerate mutase [Candidatus Bipolaricaulota bacterium]
VRVVDNAIAAIARAVLEHDGLLAIVADHGNAECMGDPGDPNTNHTTNRVPFVLVGHQVAGGTLRDGELADVAPTLLPLMGLPVPPEMTGQNLYRP